MCDEARQRSHQDDGPSGRREQNWLQSFVNTVLGLLARYHQLPHHVVSPVVVPHGARGSAIGQHPQVEQAVKQLKDGSPRLTNKDGFLHMLG